MAPCASPPRASASAVWSSPGPGTAPAPSPQGDDGEPSRCRIWPTAVQSPGRRRGSPRRSRGPSRSPCSPPRSPFSRRRSAAARQNPIARRRGRKSRARASTDNTRGNSHFTDGNCFALPLKRKKKSGGRKRGVFFLHYSCTRHLSPENGSLLSLQ